MTMLDLTPALAGRLPDLRLESLKRLSRKFAPVRQRFLAMLLTLSFERHNPHRLRDEADSFSRDFLASGLRCDRDARSYQRFLAPFWRFDERNYGYSRDDGTTKAYWLKDGIRETVRGVYLSDEPAGLIEVAEAHDRLPEGCNFTIPAVVPIPVTDVDRTIGRLEHWARTCGPTMPIHPERRTTVSKALLLAYACRKYATCLGGMPNRYREQSHGRLGPVGFHLIMLPSRPRHLLFEGRQLTDYDLAQCHWRVFRDLCRAVGYSTPLVESYIEDRGQWHGHWRSVTAIPAHQFKQVATSLLAGAGLSQSSKSENYARFGATGNAAFVRDERTQEFNREIANGLKRVIKECQVWTSDGGRKVAVNAVGAGLRPDGVPGDYRRLCSHLLTGYEQWAIRLLCAHALGLGGDHLRWLHRQPAGCHTLGAVGAGAQSRRAGVRFGGSPQGRELRIAAGRLGAR